MIPVKPAPKKETARIQVAPQKPVLPKATVKMQQTQPMAPMVAPIVAKPTIVAAEVEEVSSTGDDAGTMVLSALACVASIGAAVVFYLAYSTITSAL